MPRAPDAWSASCARRICRSRTQLNASPPEIASQPDPAQSAPGFHEPPCAPETTLIFELAPADAARLLRLPLLQARRMGAVRTTNVNHVWHDTASAQLAAQGLALSHTPGAGKSGIWRLERLHVGNPLDWLPATCAPVLAQADSLADLLPDPPAGLVAAAAFAGKSRSVGLHLDGFPGRLELLEGTLRGVARDEPACRLLLTGAPPDIAALATELAACVRLGVPRHSLAAASLALARGTPAPPLRIGAPALPPGLSTSDALACVAGHLAGVILHWSDQVSGAATPEPVHQMRVAVRRLRSVLALFRRASTGGAGEATWFAGLAASLRNLAARLGVARDWDVFIGETGAEVQAAMPDDRRIALMLAAAGRKRLAAYADLAAYLASQDWALLSLELALLPTTRPWLRTGNPETLAAPVRHYAPHALDRRLKHLLAPGGDLSALPVTELHDLRKHAKQLRYATELFSPLFSEKAGRKYLVRLARLQEVLGAVNDSAAAAILLDQLAGGADRAFAAGVVQGFGAARARRSAARVQAAWARFVRASPFWD